MTTLDPSEARSAPERSTALTKRRRRISGSAVRALAITALIAAVTTLAPGGAGAAPTSAPAGGWTLASPESQGMDPTVLQGAYDFAFQPDRHTQGVVVVRGGELVSESYAPGEGPQSWAASWSMAKSIASVLVGIAIDEGKIPGVDVSMADYIPSWQGTPKSAITLRDVLHMKSGLAWDEDYDATNVGSSDVIQMGLSRNQLTYAADRPVAHAPGTVWNYSSGDAMLLSAVIQGATGMSVGAYAQQKLFGPLGIRQAEMWQDAAGNTLTYCCTDTTSRDFARIGLLYLHDGNWGGNQIVSESWVHDSLTPVDGSDGRYGYMWWIADIAGVPGPVYMANGHDGQFTYIIPSLDMVVVRNGDYVKSACEPIADPNLYGLYPPNGLVDGAGTRPPESWSHADFLAPIVASATGASTGDGHVVPGAEATPADRNPGGEPMVPCKADQAPTTSTPPSTSTPQRPVPTPVPTGTVPAATPIAARPAYAG